MRKILQGLAGVVGAGMLWSCMNVGALVHRPVMDVYDYFNPSFTRYNATSEFVPYTEFEIEYRDEDALKDLVISLENVPDYIQRVMNGLGGTVVFFDGNICDFEELEKLEGVPMPNQEWLTWDQAPAMYDGFTKTAFIGQNQSEGWGYFYFSPALHEYGHMVDDLMGGLSIQNDFKRILDISRKRHGLTKMSEYHMENPSEFFAGCFDRFYFSDRSKRRLMKNFPEAYWYLAELDETLYSADLVMVGFERDIERLIDSESDRIVIDGELDL